MTAPSLQTVTSTETTSTSMLPDLSLFAVAAIWGVNMPVMKVGLDHMDVYAFNAIRLGISAVVLVLVALRERRPQREKLSRRAKWQVFQYAAIASGGYQVLFLLGIAQTTSGNASLIMSTVPMWTALLALLFLKERLGRLAWIGLFIALAGTLIVTGQNGFSGNQEYLRGNLIMLTAALVWATGTVKSRTVLRSISPITLSAISSVIMLPLHFAIAGPNLAASLEVLPRIDVWIPLLYSGVFSTGVALILWNYGVREAGAAHAAVFQNLIPVIAISSAWIVRGEAVSVLQIAGGTLILSGLIVMRRARNQRISTSNFEKRSPIIDIQNSCAKHQPVLSEESA